MAQRRPASRGDDYAFEDEQGEHWGARLLREVLEVAVLTLLLFVAVRMFVQNYRVDGPSMEPTLYTNEYILVDRAEYYLHPPQRGDIVVFNAPVSPPETFVKRVIGIPGDTVFVSPQGLATVDGDSLNEKYVAYPGGGGMNPQWGGTGGTITLGPNQYWVMGDDRIDSEDSRVFGPISRQSIIGKASLVYWPLSDVHPLQTFSNVFAGIHG